MLSSTGSSEISRSGQVRFFRLFDLFYLDTYFLVFTVFADRRKSQIYRLGFKSFVQRRFESDQIRLRDLVVLFGVYFYSVDV